MQRRRFRYESQHGQDQGASDGLKKAEKVYGKQTTRLPKKTNRFSEDKTASWGERLGKALEKRKKKNHVADNGPNFFFLNLKACFVSITLR